MFGKIKFNLLIKKDKRITAQYDKVELELEGLEGRKDLSPAEIKRTRKLQLKRLSLGNKAPDLGAKAYLWELKYGKKYPELAKRLKEELGIKNA